MRAVARQFLLGTPAQRKWRALNGAYEEGVMKSAEAPSVEYRAGINYLVLDGRNTARARLPAWHIAMAFPIKKALWQFKRWLRLNGGLDEPELMIRDFARSTPHLEAATAALSPGAGEHSFFAKTSHRLAVPAAKIEYEDTWSLRCLAITSSACWADRVL